MAFNLGIKLKTNSHKDYIKILKSIGAEYCGILNQKDVYFNVQSGLLKLRIENNRYTLIKYNRNEKGKRWSNYELLKLEGIYSGEIHPQIRNHKGKNPKGINPEKYLSGLFKAETVVKKKRIFYLYNNTRIHLDEVKGLGKFLELETLLVSGKKDAALRFKEMLSILKIDPAEQIHSSYKNLIPNK